ncbi:SDR family NAD(P)-dependent oxidoreductase [Acuticoccus kandeliae]|uniref:SDR family NAD(P)-dependent oxidoreductase n=1 Tax=Acuticoccus kandeliae TaxID=2073160 RepID=UPI000D3E4B00|nr:SDR family NAD(P)-dependent oxidoreductase [Acuticoccus kandeliae]
MDKQTVLVTGATAGVGAAVARRFAARGARLVLVARRGDRLDALAAELGRDDIHTLVADVSDAEAFAEALKALPAPFDAVDVLVNNAGIGVGRDLAQDSNLADWSVMVRTNIDGLIAGTGALLPGMVARGRGHVINIGSVVGEWPGPRNAIYGATKAFVRQFSLCLRADLLGTGVRVTDVEPGIIGATEFTTVRFGGDMDQVRAMYEGMTPLGPDDIADAIEWAATRPAHVNVNIVQIMPVDQAFAAPAVARRGG